MILLNNPILHRYWFQTNIITGLGVTAYSRADAEELLRVVGYLPLYAPHVLEIVDNIDISQIEYSSVRKYMGPPNLRGIWYPCLNLTPGYLIEGRKRDQI